jgi:hypothetical protein
MCLQKVSVAESTAVAAAETAASRQYLESTIGITQVDKPRDIAGRVAAYRQSGPLANPRRKIPLVRMLPPFHSKLGYKLRFQWDENAPTADFKPADYFPEKAGELRSRHSSWDRISNLAV